MKVYILSLLFWDNEDKVTHTNARAYSTEALAKQALAAAREEYGQNVNYCLAYTQLDPAN